MDYLARREHARGELLSKLTAAGFDADVSSAAVAQLVADNLQSDERFVEAFVRSRVGQGKGPARIRAELRDRDVSAAIIDQALAEADQDWSGLAVAARLKKFGPDPANTFKEKARQMRFLQARGFESEQIQAAVSASDD